MRCRYWPLAIKLLFQPQQLPLAVLTTGSTNSSRHTASTDLPLEQAPSPQNHPVAIEAAPMPQPRAHPRQQGAIYGQTFWPFRSPFGLSCRSLKRRAPQDCVHTDQPCGEQKC